MWQRGLASVTPAIAPKTRCVVEQYYPLFAALRAEQGRALPAFVQREFEDYLKCGRLEHGFLRVRCSECRAERWSRCALSG